MDSKDYQLLVSLDSDARQSYQSLGRRVSLSAPAVSHRLERLKIKGVLQGFNLMINPSVFGRVGLVLIFRGDFARKMALSALASSDVSWVTLKLDAQMIVGLWTRDQDKSIDDLANIVGTQPSERIFTPQERIAPVSIADLLIMDVLVDDPRLLFGELVKSSGLSPKTVRKHLNHLLNTKTISIVPLLGALADSGDLIYPLMVTGRVSISKVRSLMGEETTLLRHIPEPPIKYILCRADSLAGMTAKIRMLEGVHGIESATISLNREVLVSTGLRHSLIREKISELEKAQMS